MRILMISDVYFPRVNGVSTSIRTFCNDLEQLGHEITLVAPHYLAPGKAGTEEKNDPVVRVPGRVVPFDAEDRIMYRSELRRQLVNLSHNDYALVHVQTPFIAHLEGVRFAQAGGIPCVETYHTFFEEYFHHYLPVLPASWTKALTRWVARRQCNELDGLVVPSQEMLGKLREYGVDATARVIPTGLDSNLSSEGDGGRFRARHGIPRERPTLVHVGRLAFEKNIGFLLEMVAALRTIMPDVLLILSGEGPARETLERYAQELKLNDNVLFVGYQNRQGDLEDCYSAGDVFVFASRTETQGLVLLEAMSLGVPVVSLAYMGAAEILRPQRGAVIARDDPKAFADTVYSVYQDQGLRTRLAQEGRDYAREWSSVGFAGQLLQFYELVIDSFPRSPVVVRGTGSAECSASK